MHSIERLLSPSPVYYDQAIIIAVVGLLVNLTCAWLLQDGHDHGRDHEHGHHHHDLNLRSAYIHVVTDAVTSVLAIIALLGGKYWGASWLDPVMGIGGAGLVALWAYRLLCDSGRALLDAEMHAPIVAEIRAAIKASPVNAAISDLHVWRVGKGKYACILSLMTHDEAFPEDFRRQLSMHEELVHVTVEINRPALS